MLRRALFGLATVVAFFAAVEGLLALLHVRPLVAERDPFLGFSERMRVYELDRGRHVYRTPARAVMHSFNYQEFAERKPQGGLRVFVLGGSSVFGFPWGAEVAFPRVLATALGTSFPGRSVEVINAGAMSYASHRLRILARELLEYDPDLLVIYEGHNEFVEPRFYRELLERQTALDPLRELLYRWRLYSGLSRLYGAARADGRPARGEASDVGSLLGLDVVREYSTGVTDRERTEVLARFEDNLRAILAQARSHHVPVIFCTAPSNLSDWKPNQSVFDARLGASGERALLETLDRAKTLLERGDPAAAVEVLERAQASTPDYAETHYRLGLAYRALERFDEARASFTRARDLDGQPSRASSAINAVTRRVASEPGALLLDVEERLALKAPHGLLGFNLFEDYVHPKPATHRLIALELWSLILERGLFGETRRADPAEFWNSVGTPSEPEAAGPDAPLAASSPGSPRMLFNLAVVLEHEGHRAEAMDRYRECLALQPLYVPARLNLGRLLHLEGRFAEAAEQYRLASSAAVEGDERARSFVGLADALSEQGQLDAAAEAYGEATRADAASVSAWKGLGAALARAGHHAEAEVALRRALALAPADAEVQANLGFALLFQGKVSEAEREFRSSLKRRPEYRRSADGLAAVLTEQGHYDEAERLFRDSLRADPEDRFARGGLELIEQRRRSR